MMATTRAIGAARTRAPWLWATAGAVLGLLAGTTVFAPAAWLATAVSQASGQRVELAGFDYNGHFAILWHFKMLLGSWWGW